MTEEGNHRAHSVSKADNQPSPFDSSRPTFSSRFEPSTGVAEFEILNTRQTTTQCLERCSKYADHRHLIPASDFHDNHLPADNRDADILSCIKLMSELTVRLRITQTCSSNTNDSSQEDSLVSNETRLCTGLFSYFDILQYVSRFERNVLWEYSESFDEHDLEKIREQVMLKTNNQELTAFVKNFYSESLRHLCLLLVPQVETLEIDLRNPVFVRLLTLNIQQCFEIGLGELDDMVLSGQDITDHLVASRSIFGNDGDSVIDPTRFDDAQSDDLATNTSFIISDDNITSTTVVAQTSTSGGAQNHTSVGAPEKTPDDAPTNTSFDAPTDTSFDALNITSGESPTSTVDALVHTSVDAASTTPGEATTNASVEAPTISPISAPPNAPVNSPTSAPVNSPTSAPVNAPANSPTSAPVNAPANSPTSAPANSPANSPTSAPANSPANSPTSAPGNSPTSAPANSPANSPTSAPANSPAYSPSNSPTSAPANAPTSAPVSSPTSAPVSSPTSAPVNSPTIAPVSATTSAPVNATTNASDESITIISTDATTTMSDATTNTSGDGISNLLDDATSNTLANATTNTSDDEISNTSDDQIFNTSDDEASYISDDEIFNKSHLTTTSTPVNTSTSDNERDVHRVFPCLCPQCKSTPCPQPVGYVLQVLTDRRAILDNEEAKTAIVDVMFAGEIRHLYGQTVGRVGNYCDLQCLECVTHEQDLALWIKGKSMAFDRVYKNVRSQVSSPIAVLCSYPHGHAKMISVGQWTARFSHVFGQTRPLEYVSYDYNTPSCPGCTGAPVLVLGQMAGSPNCFNEVQFHYGIRSGDLNTSGVGLAIR